MYSCRAFEIRIIATLVRTKSRIEVTNVIRNSKSIFFLVSLNTIYNLLKDSTKPYRISCSFITYWTIHVLNKNEVSVDNKTMPTPGGMMLMMSG